MSRIASGVVHGVLPSVHPAATAAPPAGGSPRRCRAPRPVRSFRCSVRRPGIRQRMFMWLGAAVHPDETDERETRPCGSEPPSMQHSEIAATASRGSLGGAFRLWGRFAPGRSTPSRAIAGQPGSMTTPSPTTNGPPLAGAALSAVAPRPRQRDGAPPASCPPSAIAAGRCSPNATSQLAGRLSCPAGNTLPSPSDGSRSRTPRPTTPEERSRGAMSIWFAKLTEASRSAPKVDETALDTPSGSLPAGPRPGPGGCTGVDRRLP